VNAQLGNNSLGYIFEAQGGRQTTVFDIYQQVDGTSIYSGTAGGNQFGQGDITYSANSSCPSGVFTGATSCTLVQDSSQPPRTTTLFYDNRILVGVTDPLGRKYFFFYNVGDTGITSIVDPLGNTWSFGYQGGSTETYEFDLTSITDPDNNTSQVSYNSEGMVQSTTDPASAVTRYAYTNLSCPPGTCNGVPLTQHTQVNYPTGEIDLDNYYAGLLTSDSFGNGTSGSSTYFDSVAYDYALPTTAEGPTTVSVVAPGAQTRTMTTVVTLDPVGDVLSVRDPSGTVTTNIYDASNDFNDICFSVPPGVSTAGATCGHSLPGATSYTWNPQYGDLISVTDPLGNTTSYAYNATTGLLCNTALPTVGASASCSSPPPGSTQYFYDASGNLNKEIDASGTTSQSTKTAQYDTDDEMQWSVPGDGNAPGANPASYETTFGYYANGELQTVTGPLSRQTAYTYDGDGSVLTETDPAGVTTATYDSDERTCWTYRGTSAVSNATCNSSQGPTGSVEYHYLAGTTATTSVTDQNGNTTSYSYGNPSFPTSPTAILDAAGTAPTFIAYDANGNTCLSGPVNVYSSGPPTCGPVAQDTYDTFDTYGNVVSSTDPSGNTTTYSYGDAAFPTLATSSTNPLGLTTRYVYDTDGHRTVTEKPSGNVVSTGYDADGRPCWQAPSALFLPPHPNGQCSQPSGSGVSLFSYYPTGQQSEMIDNAGTSSQAATNYSYDASGNLMSTTDDIGKTVGYQYDDANDVICIAYPTVPQSNCQYTPSATNTVVDRASDSAGRLHSTLDWLGNTITYGYDTSSNVTSITYPSATGESVTYGYQNQLTLQSVAYSGGVVGSQTESWTPNLDELVQQNTVPAALTASGTGYQTSPAYNDVKNLTSTTNPGTPSGADTYGYAYNGELSSDLPPGTGMNPITYNYNGGSELTSKVNPNSGVTSTYAYTPDGQRCWSEPSNVSNPSCSSPPSGATSYGWNAFGQLCWTGVVASNNACSSPPTGATSYSYSGSGLRITSTAGGSTQDYTWDPVDGSGVPLLLQDGTNAYIYGPTLFGDAAPVEQISLSGGHETYLGSTPAGVQLSFSQSGGIVNKSSYSAYGVQTNSASSAASPFGYQGGYTDSTGLVYLINRYYDAATGQFTSDDPAEALTGQPYAFADSDPLNATDPSGMLIQGDGGQSCTVGGGSGTVCDPSNTAIQASLTAPPVPTLAFPTSSSPFAPPPSRQTAAPKQATTASPKPADSKGNSTHPSGTPASAMALLQWATSANENYCSYVSQNNYWAGGPNDCSVSNILQSDGYFGCAIGSGGGGCSPRWVSLGQAPSVQNPQVGSGWGEVAIEGLDGCWEGGTIGAAAGAPGFGGGALPGAVFGCILGGLAEGGAAAVGVAAGG